MAWVKIPKESHPLFYARLPRDQRVQTLQMFGAAAAKANGRLFGGLFAHSFMVKLAPADYAAALNLDGATPFDPMGNGRVMSSTVLMPEWVMDDASEMSGWLRRAFDHVVTLAAKKQRSDGAGKRTAAPSRAKPRAKRRSAKAEPPKRKPASERKPPPKRKPTSKRKPTR